MYARDDARRPGWTGRRPADPRWSPGHARAQREESFPALRFAAPPQAVTRGFSAVAAPRAGLARPESQDPARARGRFPAWQLAASPQPGTARARPPSGRSDRLPAQHLWAELGRQLGLG